VALAVGVLLYAAVVLVVLDPLDSGVDSTVMRFTWLAVAVVATLSAGIIRGRLGGASHGEGQARTAAIVVWALAEGQALIGLTVTLLTGDRVVAFGALAIFVWLWLRYPPRRFLES
jgi:hypothetical protein